MDGVSIYGINTLKLMQKNDVCEHYIISEPQYLSTSCAYTFYIARAGLASQQNIIKINFNDVVWSKLKTAGTYFNDSEYYIKLYIIFYKNL